MTTDDEEEFVITAYGRRFAVDGDLDHCGNIAAWQSSRHLRCPVPKKETATAIVKVALV